MNAKLINHMINLARSSIKSISLETFWREKH